MLKGERPQSVRMSNGFTPAVIKKIKETNEHLLCVIDTGEVVLAQKGSWLHYGFPVDEELLLDMLLACRQHKQQN
ncbi:TPA: hypothetical protein ACX6Q6_003544 [Photobacterium damselae]